MFSRIAITAMIVLTAMFAVKNGWVLRRAGLTGRCTVYANGSNGTRWEVCKGGAIQGRPDLSGKGCTSQWTKGADEYWYCPTATTASGPAGV